MRRICFLFGAILICYNALLNAASGGCARGIVSQVSRTASAVHANGEIFFRTSGLELDFDGSPKAYGARDQGEENICVGLAPRAPPCHCKFQHECYRTCQATFAAWARSGGDPRKIPDTMVSVGLGGASCSRPRVALQASPRQDWFVSETSFKTSPPAVTKIDPAWLAGQDAQLDPAKIHYAVVPGALTRPPWNAKLGDVGIAFDVASKKPVAFIVGDGGGLGEGSVSLLSALRPDHPPQLTKRRNALGEEVMSYASGIGGDYAFVIFTQSSSNVPGTRNVSTRTAADLSDWIEATARDAFKHSSIDNVIDCSRLAPPIRK